MTNSFLQNFSYTTTTADRSLYRRLIFIDCGTGSLGSHSLYLFGRCQYLLGCSWRHLSHFNQPVTRFAAQVEFAVSTLP